MNIGTGVENVHPHRYRRTLATDLLNRGMAIQDVAAILGHVDIKTTHVYLLYQPGKCEGGILQIRRVGSRFYMRFRTPGEIPDFFV